MYTVQLDDGTEIHASLRGRLKQERGPVVVGDRVAVSKALDAWTIESVDERSSALVRRGRGGRTPKVLAANLDKVFAVLALQEPPADTDLIDRLLVLVEASGVYPILVLNKLDLKGAPEAARRFSALYEEIGYRTLPLSAVSGEGLEPFGVEIGSGTSALIGPSGVGKSSLLNALEPELGLRTGELSGKGGRGRHTTVASRLIRLGPRGLVADTPGFSDIALWGVAPEVVGSCFPDFEAPAAQCRFRSCTHVHEPDCGVRDALEAGTLHESRYRSYVRLHDEAVAATS